MNRGEDGCLETDTRQCNLCFTHLHTVNTVKTMQQTTSTSPRHVEKTHEEAVHMEHLASATTPSDMEKTHTCADVVAVNGPIVHEKVVHPEPKTSMRTIH